MRVKMNQVGVKLAVSCVKGAKREQKGSKMVSGQRQVEAWGRFGRGSMNLEFDFELISRTLRTRLRALGGGYI